MSTIRVAAAQLHASRLGEPAAALADIHAAIDAAAARGAEILVLPECAYPAYCLGSVAAYRAAKVLPNEVFLSDLAARAREHRLHIVCGFVEDRGRSLANAAVLIDDRGERVGVYRKTFLWGDDNDVFLPGDDTRPFDTRWGKIGIIICADARAPETVAAHAAQGAELICVPTCWVNAAKIPGEYYNPQPDFLIPARAREFTVPFVCANRIGRETETISYCGRSLIVDYTGRRLAEAPPDREALLVAEVSPHASSVPRLSPELRGVLEGPAAPVTRDGVAVGGGMCLLCGDEVLSYPASRAAALRGATVLRVEDAPDDPALLRTRAAENRVFVLATSPRGSTLIGPDGAIIAAIDSADAQRLIGLIDASRAADKTVFPKTNIWEQRRTGACRAALTV